MLNVSESTRIHFKLMDRLHLTLIIIIILRRLTEKIAKTATGSKINQVIFEDDGIRYVPEQECPSPVYPALHLHL